MPQKKKKILLKIWKTLDVFPRLEGVPAAVRRFWARLRVGVDGPSDSWRPTREATTILDTSLGVVAWDAVPELLLVYSIL